MTPSVASANLRYKRLGYAVSRREFTLQERRGADIANGSIGKLGCPDIRPSLLTTFGNLVSHILALRAQEEMAWVTAEFVIASVADAKPAWDMPVGDNPCGPVRGHLVAAERYFPVPAPEVSAAPSPYPAPVGMRFVESGIECFRTFLQRPTSSYHEGSIIECLS